MSIKINQRLSSMYCVVSMGEMTFFLKKTFLLSDFFFPSQVFQPLEGMP